MTYCDSSFLASLYVASDVFNPVARKAASNFIAAIPYTHLNELELINALQRGFGSHSLSQADYDGIIRDIKTDEADGLLQRPQLNQIKLHGKALELSRKYTSALACRSLDILHVASALILAAGSFASFDARQRKLAATVGLKLVPQNVK